MNTLLRCLLLILLLPTPALAEPPRTFGAVTITCDDGRSCTAALAADGGEATLTLTRGPESRARWVVRLAFSGRPVASGADLVLSVDNGVDTRLKPGSGYDASGTGGAYAVLDQAALDRLMLQLQRGHSLRIRYADAGGGVVEQRVRLDGLPDGLAAIDGRQGRVIGDRRAGPPPAAGPAGTAAAGVASENPLAALQLAAGDCLSPDDPALAGAPAVSGDLGDGARLDGLACTRQDGRISYRLYATAAGEAPRRLAFALLSPADGWGATDRLDWVRYDADERVLAGETDAGDGCRLSGQWRWRHGDFRLMQLSGIGCGGRAVIFAEPS